MLRRVLPLTPIASRCKIEKGWLEVWGELGTYRIEFLWGAVIRVAGAGSFKRLNIPQKLLEDVSADLAAFPIDLDSRTEAILHNRRELQPLQLRKAYVLVNDGKIDSPDLIRQL
jgi:hypothetical protein